MGSKVSRLQVCVCAGRKSSDGMDKAGSNEPEKLELGCVVKHDV